MEDENGNDATRDERLCTNARNLSSPLRKYGVRKRGYDGADGSARYIYSYDGICYVTDETGRIEITAFLENVNATPKTLTPDDQYYHQQFLAAVADKTKWRSHTVLVIDMSDSMKLTDVPGYVGQRSRAEHVFNTLALDFIQTRISTQEASGTDVISVILMQETATIAIRHKPTDNVLYNEVLKLKMKTMPVGHGNYLPAIDAAKALLDYNSSAACALGLFFLSDGKPSDPTPKGTEGTAAGVAMANCKRIGERFGNLASEYGRRLSVATVGFGPKDVDYSVLRTMAQVATEYGCKANFSQPGRDTKALENVMMSLTTSITETQTELISKLKVTGARNVRQVVRKSAEEGVSDAKSDLSQWKIFDREANQLKKFTYDIDINKFIAAEIPENIKKFYIHRKAMGEGAERIVNEFVEVTALGNVVGDHLVYKQSRFEDDVDQSAIEKFGPLLAQAMRKRPREIEIFMGTQRKAAFIADKFNILLDRFLSKRGNKVPRIEYLEVWLYEHFIEGEGLVCGLVEKYLEGKYQKWNTNAGYVRGGGETIKKDNEEFPDLASTMIEEGDEDEEEDDDDDDDFIDVTQVTPSEACQAFSHFSWVFSRHKLLVCDLQGIVDNKDKLKPPILRLTDPVIHSRSTKEKKDAWVKKFGRTDGGNKGMNQFFETHVCGPLCKALKLEERPDSVSNGEAKGWEGLLGMAISAEQRKAEKEKARKERAAKKEALEKEKRRLEKEARQKKEEERRKAMAEKKAEEQKEREAGRAEAEREMKEIEERIKAVKQEKLEKARMEKEREIAKKKAKEEKLEAEKREMELRKEEQRQITAELMRPFCDFCAKGDLRAAKLTREEGLDFFDVNYVDKENDNYTPLHTACESGNLNLVKWLVADLEADVNVVEVDGFSPLIIAASQGESEIVKYLVTKTTANVDLPDVDGNNALHRAANVGNLDIVRILVENGSANLNMKSGRGRTALEIAQVKENTAVVLYLEAAGAGVKKGGGLLRKKKVKRMEM